MKTRQPLPITKDELLWSGHLYDYSGYAKSNREVLFRLGRQILIQATRTGLTQEARSVDGNIGSKVDFFIKNRVSDSAALLRFYVPLFERGDRYKICYTMIETVTTHPDFVSRLNSYYDEVWTPTEWNKRAFWDSGVRKPIYVIPLGIDHQVYKPGPALDLPPCHLISTKEAGKFEIPQGFHFVSIFQPTFRKGLVVLLRAFQKAFGHQPDTNLIIGCTAHGFSEEFRNQVKANCPTAKVYLMSGNFDELEMANICRSSHAYVSTSLGEGCNLPAMEAGACGIPCILPAHSGHLQFADDTCAYMIPPDEVGTIYGAGMTCIWYAGMYFHLMNEKATQRVADAMLDVRNNYAAALEKAKIFSERLRSRFTWDMTAQTAMERLKAIWK